MPIMETTSPDYKHFANLFADHLEAILWAHTKKVDLSFSLREALQSLDEYRKATHSTLRLIIQSTYDKAISDGVDPFDAIVYAISGANDHNVLLGANQYMSIVEYLKKYEAGLDSTGDLADDATGTI